MDNLEFYNKLRAVPDIAKKEIGGGKLKGMTDVSPMYRIKVMTEVFGVCGFGWKYEVVSQWLENYGNEVKAFCNINLYVKVGGEWSDAIPGTGGSSFVSMEKNGAYVSDECHKMALTDALSVAMKALGVAADVYYSKDANFGTKYEKKADKPAPKAAPEAPAPVQAVADQSPVDAENELKKELFETTPDIMKAASKKDLVLIWSKHPKLQSYAPFKELMGKRKAEVKA